MRKIKNPGKLTKYLLPAAIVMCIIGAVTGEADDVFMKAVNICMECIGLG